MRIRLSCALAALLALCLAGCADKFAASKKELLAIAADFDGKTKELREGLEAVRQELRDALVDPSPDPRGLFPDREYLFFEDAIYCNPKDDGNGSMFYTGYVPVGPAQKAKVRALERVIPSMKAFIEEGPMKGLVTQVYFVTGDSLICNYPFVDNLSFVPPKRDIQTRRIWTGNDRANNPRRATTWSAPYVDTTGKGYVVDVNTVLDIDGVQAAALGADLTVKALKGEFSKRKDLKLLFLDPRSAKIVAMSAAFEEFFSMGNVEAFKYLRMIDNAAPDRPEIPDNLILTKTDSQPMRDIWAELSAGRTEFRIERGTRSLRAAAATLSETGWVLLLVE